METKQELREKAEVQIVKINQRNLIIQEVHQHVKNHMMIYLTFICKKFNKEFFKKFKINQ